MDKEELSRKYRLVDNDNYKALRTEYLNLIVEKANSQLSSELLRGMLLLINESDSWERDYLIAVERERKKKE